MVKKLLSGAFGAAVLAVMAGCSSVDVTNNFNDVNVGPDQHKAIAHINAKIYGIYFVNWLPVFAGSNNHEGKSTAFRNTVSLDGGVKMLTRKSREIGASRVVDMESNLQTTWNPFFLFFTVRSVQVSGTAVR